MDPRLLEYYNRELQHLREMGQEFAREYPGAARRLGLDAPEPSDPYVERLLEGFSFLAARVQLKLDAQFPLFTQHLLEMVYPHYLAPTPSMAVVRIEPTLSEGALAEGFTIERDTPLRTILGKGQRTPCEYRTSQDVTLWPLEIQDVEYFTHALDVPGIRDVKAGFRLRLKATAGLKFDALALDRLQLYLHGADELPMRLYRHMLADAVAVVAQPVGQPPEWREVLDAGAVRSLGFDEEQALLPNGPRSFEGYRLLHEYFAFPQRYSFVEIAGLAPAVRRCKDDQLDLIVLFRASDTRLENAISASHVALFCTPAINLFPKHADRIHVTDRDTEFHVVPDRNRPLDLEVYDVTQVVGHGTAAEDEEQFLPFYASKDVTRHLGHEAFFTVRREPRMLSSKQRRDGTRAGYLGHEVYLTLVDGKAAPFSTSLKQLDVTTRVTNRDLPLLLAMGGGRSDFSLQTGAPWESIRCLAGPTWPRTSHARGETAWRLISHLSLNYLSLLDTDPKRGAAALRDLLSLYADVGRAEIGKQVEGVRSVESRSITRRLPVEGPLTFGRGLEIAVTFDETAFEGVGVFLLGAVLESFFAKYVSINSFTETVIRTVDHGEVMRWPARNGRRHTL